ncbi:WD repeat-containing protein 63 [Nephila pilipes]|uniref:WD repeat-containing protein 63 n=1 Tax=Nephila pilipes TaxID=299642 RepID=A0A8X6QAY5_NEPPI|nr:WD repeat-containing protein 63 [Nephila pilipes]
MESEDVPEIEKQKSYSQKFIQEIGRIDSEIDKEVKEEQYNDFKTKTEILVQVGKDKLRSCTFTDCYTTDRPGMHLEILPKIIFEAIDDETSPDEIDVQKPIFRQTVDQGTQASIEFKSSKAQTSRSRMVNSWSQYEPRLFTEDDIQSHLNQPSFLTFREITEKSILESLTQNNIADSFFWDLTSLFDETTIEDEEKSLFISGSFSCTESKDNIFVTSTTSCITLEKRSENLLEVQDDSILFFVWSARNQFFSKLLLEYFDDLSVIKFNPVKPNLLAAGSITGQLILWDVKRDIFMNEHDDDNFDSLADFTTPPVDQCIAISSMDHIHKYGITDLHWVPPDIEISFRGDIIKNAPSGFQIITCGLDGCLQFWDLKMGFQPKPGNPFPRKFNQLDGVWEPFHSIKVLPPKGNKRKSLTCFVLRRSAEANAKENGNGEYSTSEFYGGCDDGQLLCGSFKLVRDDAGKYIVQQPEYFKSPFGGAVTVLACSPFINDVFLSAGGRTIALWKHNIKNEPVFLRERNTYITSGQWSPTKPALFVLGFLDGSIEIWDLVWNLYQPFATRFISTSAIKSISIQSLKEKEHLVAAGDSKGVVYTMNLLPRFWTPRENELEKISKLVETESNRILKQATDSPVVSDSPKKVPQKKPSEKFEDVKTDMNEETFMANNYKEFLRLQRRELIAMGLLEDEENKMSEEEIQ